MNRPPPPGRRAVPSPDSAPRAARARDRKAEHIRLALDERMQLQRHYFDRFVFQHVALPEIDFDDIELQTPFLGHTLAAPLLISCMTGGTEQAQAINRNLALAAEETGIAIGVGSQRKALEDPSAAESFRVRPFAPSVPLLANLGAVQLNYGYGVDACRQAVEMIDADALVLHLNPLQEAIQPEGQRNFAGLIDKIGTVAEALVVPVIVKEVGSGISAGVARRLIERGIGAFDTAGMGGTNWARIEGARADDAELGERFAGWGIPTPRAIRELRRLEADPALNLSKGLTLIGSGGIRHGLDLAKALALGADLGGMAYRFLEPAADSKERVVETIRTTLHELKIAMFCVGARTPSDLRRVELYPVDSGNA